MPVELEPFTEYIKARLEGIEIELKSSLDNNRLTQARYFSGKADALREVLSHLNDTQLIFSDNSLLSHKIAEIEERIEKLEEFKDNSEEGFGRIAKILSSLR